MSGGGFEMWPKDVFSIDLKIENLLQTFDTWTI